MTEPELRAMEEELVRVAQNEALFKRLRLDEVYRSASILERYLVLTERLRHPDRNLYSSSAMVVVTQKERDSRALFATDHLGDFLNALHRHVRDACGQRTPS